MLRIKRLALLVFFSSFFMSGITWADLPQGPSWYLKAPALAQAARISPEAAMAKARQANGGRVLSIDTQQRGGRLVYRVKMLVDQGRVMLVFVDAQSGAIVK